MSTSHLMTPNLELVLTKLEDARAQIEQMDPEQRKHLSADWLARLHNATGDDPWVLGFGLILRSSRAAVGQCGFKGPPDANGAVEIAYAIAPEHQGRGYATEAAEALTRYALATGQVKLVRAHTLPESNASTRVLTKCGFRKIGEVIDPEDGLVWRWERLR